MSYEEEQQRRSRVVVETPTARREVVRTDTTHVPERQGFSTGAVAALVIGAVALVTILFLFLMRNQQDETNINARVATQPTTTQPQQQPVIVQQPAPVQQPPIVVQQPATTQPAPVIVTPPASDSGSTTSGNNDAAVQSSVDKKISDDTQLASLGITALVMDGKATLTGMVNSEALKARAERVVRSVKGVRTVENKIIVEP